MRALSGELLLEAWERAVAEPELVRALTLLGLALPEADREQLAAMPVAERNLMLLRLHELSFGPRLDAVASCHRCGAPFEFSVPVADLMATATTPPDGDVLEWREEGGRYRLRQLNTDDLLASLEVADPREAQEVLLTRCLVASPAERSGPSSGVLEKFDELNAGVELTCTMPCPECASEEIVDLDVARFLWIEVRRAASQLLRDVHDLASAYGWSERSILELDVRRRTAYLELLGR
ncbi:MAG: hypothetical protein M3071_03175 [Actinomycetota bacterium]|nr:hypothetical protein [Actinomycetota bacterium]